MERGVTEINHRSLMNLPILIWTIYELPQGPKLETTSTRPFLKITIKIMHIRRYFILSSILRKI